MAKALHRAANRPLLVTRINLWWYVLALVPIVGLGWLAASNLIPGIVLPLVIFAAVFWLSSFVMAIFAKLRAPRMAKSIPESRS